MSSVEPWSVPQVPTWCLHGAFPMHFMNLRNVECRAVVCASGAYMVPTCCFSHAFYEYTWLRCSLIYCSEMGTLRLRFMASLFVFTWHFPNISKHIGIVAWAPLYVASNWQQLYTPKPKISVVVVTQKASTQTIHINFSLHSRNVSNSYRV